VEEVEEEEEEEEEQCGHERDSGCSAPASTCSFFRARRELDGAGGGR
jgi:hypothetical protein